MTALALGIAQDLRARRLLPVAIVLALALVAVPLLLLEPAEEVEPAATGAAPAAAPAANGLPSPQQALNGEGNQLVKLAVLSRPSDLESFDSKNPFKPLESILPLSDEAVGALASAGVGAGAAQSQGAGEGGLAALGADGGGSGGSGAGAGSGGSGSGGSGSDGSGSGGSGGDGSGGDAGPDIPPLIDPDGGSTPPTPTDPDPAEPERRFTLAVDLTFDGPSSAPRRYRSLPRLSMLPNQVSPLLVFLGVGPKGNDAVFLVDSTLQAVAGDGACEPEPTQCATVAIEPGEQQTFIDDRDRKYTVAVDQIREVPLAEAEAAESARAMRAEAAGAARGDSPRAQGAVAAREPRRRFVPQLIDMLVIGGQR